MTHYHSHYQRQRFRQRSLGLLVFFFLAAFMVFSGSILAYYFIPGGILLSLPVGDQHPRNRLIQISFAGDDF